jgi:hypothetical protein
VTVGASSKCVPARNASADVFEMNATKDVFE